MTQSGENSFELRGDDNTPTKQMGDSIDPSATSDEIYQLEPGSFVGRYAIRKRIGAGGFGVVFLGADSVLKRVVCIKISRTHESLQSEAPAELGFGSAGAFPSRDRQSCRSPRAPSARGGLKSTCFLMTLARKCFSAETTCAVTGKCCVTLLGPSDYIIRNLDDFFHYEDILNSECRRIGLSGL